MRYFAVVLACLSLSATAIFAQNAVVVQKGTTEIGGFVGASYGAQNFQVMGGGNVSYAVTKALMPYAEFSYFPGLPITTSLTGLGDAGTKATANYRLPLADVHFGVHYRFPVHEKPFVPYGVFGLGLLHNFKSNVDYNYIILGKPTVQTNVFCAWQQLLSEFRGRHSLLHATKGGVPHRGQGLPHRRDFQQLVLEIRGGRIL